MSGRFNNRRRIHRRQINRGGIHTSAAEATILPSNTNTNPCPWNPIATENESVCVSKRREREWETTSASTSTFTPTTVTDAPNWNFGTVKLPVTPDHRTGNSRLWSRDSPRDSCNPRLFFEDVDVDEEQDNSEAPLAVITQSSDSEMEFDDDDALEARSNLFGHCLPPAPAAPHRNNRKNCIFTAQRKKSRTDPYTFTLSAHAIPSPSGDNSAAATATAQPLWWKRQISGSQNKSMTPERSSSATRHCKCHVCQAPAPVPSANMDGDVHMNRHNPSRYIQSQNSSNAEGMDIFASNAPIKKHGCKQKNSLLSYFNPSKSKSKSNPTTSQKLGNATKISTSSEMQSSTLSQGSPTAAHVPVSLGSSLSSCSYCDRPACNSCMRTCEGECNLRYCTFCSKINYDGPVERVFCFNCHDCECEESGSDGDGCRMDTS